MELWIMLKVDHACKFEFQGAFSSEDAAVTACRIASRECPDSASYGVGPVTIDTALPTATTEWPGFYYPRTTDT